MHTSSAGDPEAEAWTELLDRLRSSVPELADDFISLVVEIPAYTAHVVDEDELRASARDVLLLMVDAIRDPTTYPEVTKYAQRMGERRAQQGVPVEALTAAVRLDFPMIWGKMLALADPGHHPLLAREVERVWAVVDDYATTCYLSYMAERMRAARVDANYREEFVAALFSPEGTQPEVQERFVRVFEAPAHGPYAILAVNGHPSQQMREEARRARRYLHEASSHSFLFWPVAGSSTAEMHGLPIDLADEPCGLALSPEGLSGLAGAARQAIALADQLTPEDEGPLTVGKHWPRIARRHLATTGIDLAASLEKDLESARPGEADRLREAVVRYLETGSVTDTAQQIFAHRNTVLNRLRRFGELTGIDLNVPAQAARVAVAWLG